MPMGNRTGPEGLGPGTGRRAGFCSGYNAPGCYNRPFYGHGRGRTGAGRGFRGYYGAAGISDEDYKTMLRGEAEFLENRLNEVRNQLKDSGADSE